MSNNLNNKNNSLVSVIMNCHNGQKYLYDSVTSLLSQTYTKWELIFWDNLSEDNSKITNKILLKTSFKFSQK